ncbi:uncharacterized protein [Euwallacea fornicatus]|uniref:uncharacterized protein n=1 Tax=Euwallacea fornicatus TaxID=995702 RepID=UPI00338F8E0D
MISWYVLLVLTAVYCQGRPASLLETLVGVQKFKDEDNSVGSYVDEFADLDKYFTNRTSRNYTIIPFNTEFPDGTDKSLNTTTKSPLINSLNSTTNEKKKLNESRTPRRELEEKESQEEEEDEDGDGGGVGGLFTALLSGLSGPDGSINLDAISGLLGSLSSQNPDGTYDFSGLSDTLRQFFVGGSDGGGSDIGSFVGGLVGAAIKGLANPPGAKGAGILAGKVVTGVLPALSGPAPSDDTDSGTETKPAPALDSGSFVIGFLKPFLAGSGGNGTGGDKPSKFTVIKAVISMATGLVQSFVAASSSSKSSDWND